MKTKELIIGIKTPQELAQRVKQAMTAIQKGETVAAQKETLSFVSLEAARSFFTPKRIELLKMIHRHQPESVYALAKLAERQLKSVQEDVKLLIRAGLIGIDRESRGRDRMKPKVEYDELDVHMKIAV